MKPEEFNSKYELCEAAINLYMHDDYSIPNLAEKTDKTTSEIYSLFPNKISILKFYYQSLVIRYRAMIDEIDDYQTYSLSEKLSNFIFTLFDMMEEQRAFVERTYKDWELRPFNSTKFHKEIQRLVKDVFTTDTNVALSSSFLIGDYFYAFLQTEYLYLIKFWLNDDSRNYERTLALTDKFTGFIEEAAYSKIVDKGFELMKFSVSSTNMGKKIPVFGSWISRWIDEKEEEEI